MINLLSALDFPELKILQFSFRDALSVKEGNPTEVSGLELTGAIAVEMPWNAVESSALREHEVKIMVDPCFWSQLSITSPPAGL